MNKYMIDIYETGDDDLVKFKHFTLTIIKKITEESSDIEKKFFYEFIKKIYLIDLDKNQPYKYGREGIYYLKIYFSQTVYKKEDYMKLVKDYNIPCYLYADSTMRWSIQLHIDMLFCDINAQHLGYKSLNYPYSFKRIGKFISIVNDGPNGTEQIYFRHRLLDKVTNTKHLIPAYKKETNKEAKEIIKTHFLKFKKNKKYVNVYREIILSEILDNNI